MWIEVRSVAQVYLRLEPRKFSYLWAVGVGPGCDASKITAETVLRCFKASSACSIGRDRLIGRGDAIDYNYTN